MGDGTAIDNPYKILHVDRSAPQEVITAVYRHLAKTYHPDTAPTHLKTEYTERMRVINAAYEILGDPQKRRVVDLLGSPDSDGEAISVPMAKWITAKALVAVGNDGGGRTQCFNEGIKLLREVVKETEGTPASLNALSAIADIYAEGLQDHINAAGVLIRLHGELSAGVDRDELLIEITECYIKASSWDPALKYCQRAIAESEFTHVKLTAEVAKGDIMSQLKQHQDAILAFRHVVDTYPDTDQAAYSQYRIARIEDSDRQRYSDAIGEYRTVLSKYPNSEWAKDCQWRIDHLRRKHIEKKGWWES